jgi:hypothetical protein
MWAELATPTAEAIKQMYTVLCANDLGCGGITGESNSRVRSVRSYTQDSCRNTLGIKIPEACGSTSIDNPEKAKVELLDVSVLLKMGKT